MPVRVLNGPFMGSMNMPGISLSLLNLTNVAAECPFTVEDLLAKLDAPHNSSAWPTTQNIYPVPDALASRSRADQYIDIEEEKKVVPEGGARLLVDPKGIHESLKVASEDVIALEPDLTRWDTIVGDGDCGETCAQGAEAVLKHLKEGLGKDGDVVGLFRELTEIIDGMSHH